MCGIFGFVQPSSKGINTGRQALNTLAHRGPDQWNDWHNQDVYLGHRRLSIMDLSEKGRQPMTDGRIRITVNGEIYNYLELKEELNVEFSTGSDSEVLIEGYKQWGIKKLLKKIEGMYAFALYDEQIRHLYLARDRVGIKPLYYSKLDGLSWASELKAFAEYYPKMEVDYSSIYDYLTYLYIPTPKTMYKHVYKLEPATYLEVDTTNLTIKQHRFWQLEVADRVVGPKEASDKLRHLIDVSVKQQLMSDVPIGFFLSGGLDSSTVVASASQYSDQLNTYSIGFDVAEHDETHYAKIVANRFKTNHLRGEISVKEVKKAFPKLRQWYDEPFADTSAFPTHLVSKFARQSSTVALTGDGGDEVFGGYNWYRKFIDQAPRGSVFAKIMRRVNTDSELEYYTGLMGGLTHEQKVQYRRHFNIPYDYDDYWHFRKFYRPELPVLTRLQYMDFHTYLPDDILTKVDRASMAVALECRVPLLATELIEYMFSLSEKTRYYKGELKGLLKYAYKDILPTEILERDKKGFSIPTGKWKSELMNQKAPMPVHILRELYPELLTGGSDG